MSGQDIAELECVRSKEPAAGAGEAHGAPGLPRGSQFKVRYASGLDIFGPDTKAQLEKLAAEAEAWQQRQGLAEEWRAAAEAAGALDFLLDDPLLEDGD
ncbi:MAG TPA: hypothetical protein VNE39_12565 [Planctomycetota bacterium]|nr:hypothetical protein [Planctomycetota bacterium]